MRIGFVSQPIDRLLTPSRNSIGIWTRQVARHLADQNEVIVYQAGSLRGGPPVLLENVRYLPLRTFPQSVSRWIIRFFSKILPVQKPFYASVFYGLGYALQAALDLRRRRCDIVHIQNFSQFVPIIRLLNPRSRIVLHMHCEWLTQLDRAMIAGRLAKVDAVAGCSQYILQKVQNRFPEYAGKCYTLYNGVDETLFHPTTEVSPAQARVGAQHKPTILFVGRVSPEKGVHVLFEAFNIVAQRYPYVHLTLIGSMRSANPAQIVQLSDDPTVADLARFYRQPYIDSLKKTLPDALHDQVSFLGSRQHDEIPGHLREADILVNPSLSESFGMALIEAMACGTAVIATRVGGMVEVVQDGKTGLLVPPDSPQKLAAAILHMIEHPEQRRRLAQAGREFAVERFSWPRISDDCTEVYRKILSDAPTVPQVHPVPHSR